MVFILALKESLTKMSLWLYAILPPPNISTEIIVLQKEIEQRFGAVHAQKVGPHITLIPPFECEKKEKNIFDEKLIELIATSKQRNIKIHLDNFQHFNSKTLFIDVAKNESLLQFRKNMMQLFYNCKLIKQRVEKHYFVPHITLANKDLKKHDFKQAWQELKTKSYQKEFYLETISVLNYHKKKWQVVNNFNF